MGCDNRNIKDKKMKNKLGLREAFKLKKGETFGWTQSGNGPPPPCLGLERCQESKQSGSIGSIDPP